MSYTDYVVARESPTGADNAAGSGAFGRFQFMPATAAELARKTPWGAGATPENVKALVTAAPGRDEQLFNLYNARSKDALLGAGLPTDNTSMLALHRFGQGGGVSLLQAPGNMPVAQWVNSVNWGPGVSADAVIRQNRLDRYANVADLRRGFLGGNEPAPAPASVADVVAGPPPAAAPLLPQPATVALPPLVSMFEPAPAPVDPAAAEQARRQRLLAAFAATRTAS